MHAARSIRERSETALCAARAPPRRRVGSRPAKRVFAKAVHLRRTSSSVNGDDHRTSERSGGRDRRRFHDRDLNGRVPKSALAEPLKSPSSSPGRPAWQLRRGRERLENKKINIFTASILRRSLQGARTTYLRAARNGPLRRESSAEATSWVSGPRNAFLQKLCIWAKWRRGHPGM